MTNAVRPAITPEEEAEANAFAMELLMPRDWVRRDAAKVDLTDDKAVEKLAKRYRVPVGVMAVRISQVCDGDQHD